MKFNYALTYSFTNIFRSLYMYMYDACPCFLIYPPPPEDVVSWRGVTFGGLSNRGLCSPNSPYAQAEVSDIRRDKEELVSWRRTICGGMS